MYFIKAKFVKNIYKMLKNVGKCYKMLNVGNINKNVEMLKNVDTKIKFFDKLFSFSIRSF